MQPSRGLLLVLLCLPTLAHAADAPRSALPPLRSAATEARFHAALAEYARGVSLSKSGQSEAGNQALDRSIAELRAVLEQEPRAWVYYSLGQALRLRGNCQSAQVAYRDALTRIPEESLPERGKADFIDRTKQQIAACQVDQPAIAPTPPAPPAHPSVSTPTTPPPSEVVLARAPPRTRYSIVVPAALAAVAGGVLIVGGTLYGVSGSRYDRLLTDGCGSTRLCDESTYGGVRAMERAGIGLFVAGGVLAAVDVGLWAAWRRR